jgi:hypothetical protein
MKLPHAVIVSGLRRVGKSTLLAPFFVHGVSAIQGYGLPATDSVISIDEPDLGAAFGTVILEIVFESTQATFGVVGSDEKTLC